MTCQQACQVEAPSSYATLVECAEKIDALEEERRRVLTSIEDVWTPLRRRAPAMRQLLGGLELPINSRRDLIKKLGGEDKIHTVLDLDGHLTAYTTADFVEGLGEFLDRVLPVESWESLVKQIIAYEAKVRREGGRHLLRNMPHKNLSRVLENPKSRDKALLDQSHRVFRRAFDRELPRRLLLTRKGDGTATSLIGSVSAFHAHHGLDATLVTAVLELIRQLFEKQEADEHAATAHAKAGSAVTQLNNAENQLNTASSLLDNVLSANNLTATVEAQNQQADDAINAASQLIAQAIADLAAAEAAAQQVPGNAEAQQAVAEAQAKLEELQNQLNQMIRKQQQAEDHKDMLRIPVICVTIRCIEDDPCCDDDWNGVQVCITNQSNSNVPRQCATTSGNGSATICGRFGNSNILVETSDGGDWNVRRTYTTSGNNQNFTIRTDLPGFE